MATDLGRLNLARAKVVGSDGVEFRQARLAVVDGVAYLTDAAGADRGSRGGVTSVVVQAGGWLVTFDNDDTWTVARDSAPCGCGG